MSALRRSSDLRTLVFRFTSRLRSSAPVVALFALGVFGCGFGASGGGPSEAPRAASRNSRTAEHLPPLNARERQLATELRADVAHLSETIGERSAEKKWELADAADWLVGQLERAGYPVERQGYEVDGIAAQNLIVEVGGARERSPTVVIGAHYDSAKGSPGADDNASGVAAVLALARRFRDVRPARTLRFAFFALEEAPYFQSEHMGSLVFAKAAAARGEKIAAMLSIESIGYYSDIVGSQRYPQAIAAGHPSTGNFLAVVGNPESGALIETVVKTLRERGSLPVEGAALAEDVAGWSDHWSFWQIGVSAAMVTDTAPFRNPHYHRHSDTLDRLDFERMARAVAGLEHVVAELSGVRRAGAGTK